jgi:hypothetical protein
VYQEWFQIAHWAVLAEHEIRASPFKYVSFTGESAQMVGAGHCNSPLNRAVV